MSLILAKWFGEIDQSLNNSTWEMYFLIYKNSFRHLKLEIASAIPDLMNKK